MKDNNIYTIKYTYKNGYRGIQHIMSRCESAMKLKEIIEKQLDRSKCARFKVIVPNGPTETKLVNGWLLSIDLRSFSIE